MLKVHEVIKMAITICIVLFLMALTFFSFPEIKTFENHSGKPFQTSSAWNQDSISHLKAFINKEKYTDAFIAIHNGKLILETGETDKLINLHSVRKPIMSLLIGIAKDKGFLKLNETLGSLGISESGIELSPQEKTATIRNLLMSRSGVYIDADAQPNMEVKRPERDQYKPGEYYYYNNFDFNVLATILKLKTGMSYEECLFKWLAVPLEMQEFQTSNVKYGTPFSKLKTKHPAYKTWMSARDLAKVGVMIVQGGIYKNKQIVSKSWIQESTTPFHKFQNNDFNWPRDSFGYLWTLDTEKKNIWGSGYGGQFLMIDTTNQIVLVQRHNTGNSILSQGLYSLKNTQSSPTTLMQVWYSLIRNLTKTQN